MERTDVQIGQLHLNQETRCIKKWYGATYGMTSLFL